MHNNFYFLRQLASELNILLSGSRINMAFSQQKDELIIEFQQTDGRLFYFRAHFTSSFSSLHFPEKFSKAKKNVVTLFHECINETVEAVRCASFERVLILTLSDGSEWQFMLFGNRSNIIHFKEGILKSQFREALELPGSYNPQLPDRAIDLSRTRFMECGGDLRKFNPTLGNEPLDYLKSIGYHDMSIEDRWQAWQEIDNLLQVPTYYLCHQSGKPFLSLLPFEDAKRTGNSAVYTLNAFFEAYFYTYLLQSEKNAILKQVQRDHKKAEKKLDSTVERLKAVQKSNPKEIADVIMANIHALAKGSGNYELFNFYSGESIKIEIPEKSTPQKVAEKLYAKHKNQSIEIQQLNKKIEELKSHMQQTEDVVRRVSEADNIRELRKFSSQGVSKREEPLPFRLYTHDGFQIYVGKNDRSNDEILRSHTSKDDTWLHVKDVAGSHVIIKTKGTKIPDHVLERAAELAAYHSKRRTESLVAVTFTLRKYVRKFKGAAPGQVRVDREQVIMVPPRP